MFYLFVFSMKLQKFQHSLSKVGKKEKEKENTNSLTAIAATSAAYSSFCTLTRKTEGGESSIKGRLSRPWKEHQRLLSASRKCVCSTILLLTQNCTSAVVKYRAKRWSGHASRDKADKLGTLLHLTVPLSGNAISCCLFCLTLHLGPCTLHLAPGTLHLAPGMLSLPIEPEPG